jgi:pSer/pThr/pTyr-binding forkhead associated (FHA) protein
MKQYWTPLAKFLGMSKAQHDSMPAVMENVEQMVSPVVDGVQSPWPDLYRVLREHAQSEWVVRSQRHANINPDERLSITRLQIRATSPELDLQLQQWFAESDMPHLIQWMVRGPFKTVAIEHWVVLDALGHLEVLPLPLANAAPVSPYDVTDSRSNSSISGYEIVAETRWAPKRAFTNRTETLPPLELMIHDALGERRIHVMQTLVVLGVEKILKMPDGQQIQLKDQSPVPWQGETAWFVAIAAQHVSGMHLVLRLHDDGVDCLDAGSTNGSYVNGQLLNPRNWHLVKHMETVFLGGPASDPRSHTACVQLRVGHPVRSVGKDRTPLRTAPAQALPPKLLLQPLGDSEMGQVPVYTLPFTIGRGADCDWVIPARHEMVSRQHLLIEEVDALKQQVKLRDLSRQMLSESHEGWRGAPAQGVWVACTDTITIGKSDRHQGLSFCFAVPMRAQSY